MLRHDITAGRKVVVEGKEVRIVQPRHCYIHTKSKFDKKWSEKQIKEGKPITKIIPMYQSKEQIKGGYAHVSICRWGLRVCNKQSIYIELSRSRAQPSRYKAEPI